MRGADYASEFGDDAADPYFRAEWIGWVDSPADLPPLSSVCVDGTTAVAWGERDGVLYILDVYEVETSGSEPAIHFNAFRPKFLPPAHRVSWKPGIILAAAIALSTSTLAVLLVRAIVNTIRSHA